MAGRIATLAAGLAVWLFWWQWHPEVLAYQEQYQMWQCTALYLWQHVATPGGVSTYVAEFLTQFNLYPALGAAIIAALQMVAICRRPLWLAPLLLPLNWMMGDLDLLPSLLVSLAMLSASACLVAWRRRFWWIAVPALAWCCWGTHYRIPHQWLRAPGFDAERCEVLRYDILVRDCRWDDIVSMARHKAPRHPLALQAFHLALAKRGELAEHAERHCPCGIEGLMYAWRNNSYENVMSSEVAWHTALVNTAMRYTFDSQEGIPDKRKSARMMKRMAECCIVNGDYRAARKYLNKLRHTTLYRIWAERAEACLDNDAKVEAHPVWGEKRCLRFKEDFLFSYAELDKMFGLLALESEGRNKMAVQYYRAAGTLMKKH